MSELDNVCRLGDAKLKCAYPRLWDISGLS